CPIIDFSREFTISYLAPDEDGCQTYLALLSDWDLDAAFLGSSDPFLQLKVDLKPFEEGLEDWDIITPRDIPQPHITGPVDKTSITGTILNQVEKTFNMVQRALNIGESDQILENIKPLKQPMTDIEFHNYLDSTGRLVQPKELRLSVYQGGLDPSLRKVVWKHILNVYSEGLTAKERINYMRQKSMEYSRLCSTWQNMIAAGQTNDIMQHITNMVRKDVLRTDRTHKFYAGSDDNKNVVSLFNILTTYSVNHPSVSYCQGMSDLASPILVTMKDESHAYVCFCALMQRLKPNFSLDGEAMTLKFQHLSELLQHYDPQFSEYLQLQGADDLLFCYRWLLLELKREFAFDDALHMLEVLWSSLPPGAPKGELPLSEDEFFPVTSHLNGRENPYTKVRAIRKQNSSRSVSGMKLMKEEDYHHRLKYHEPAASQNLGNSSCRNEQSGIYPVTTEIPDVVEEECSTDDSQEYLPMTTSITRELRMELENLNRNLPGSTPPIQRSFTTESDDLDSPHSQISPDPNSCDSCSICRHSPAIDEDTHSLTSDDQSSGGDQIHRFCSIKSRSSDTLEVNGECDVELVSSIPQELEFEHLESTPRLNFQHCNGEILENEESYSNNGLQCSCHLKSVIPIRLVHSPGPEGQRCNSDSSDSFPERQHGEYVDNAYRVSFNNHSDGYGSESTVSSKEEADGDQVEKNGFLDSGMIESVMTNSCEDALEFNGRMKQSQLPPPDELGGGNPFMLFLCLTLLLQHRDTIMRNNMDYNELAMYFDKMVRKHNVQRVLHQARSMFAEYLRMGWHEESWESVPDPQV
ncbi:TBC1 domain family member 25-like, partial [Limulus polyphemus]|uniref:TBC1 domain family member 25-like n=1 Tax=Limulus polyphemus TaxID=6850 RepID=A0ABM1BYS9_LIMPO